MRTVCIVQARTGSKRLPGKVLLPLNGHTVIGEVLTRCRQIVGIDEVVCTIPTGDDELAHEAITYGPVSYGPEHDVLLRYYRAAKEHKADIIMRVTGDCPLISPQLCAAVLDKLIETDAYYASNIDPRTFPQGLDCEVFTADLLHLAHLKSAEREHVTTWMRTAANVRRANMACPWQIDGRLTLDTVDDYRTICAAFGHDPVEHLRAA